MRELAVFAIIAMFAASSVQALDVKSPGRTGPRLITRDKLVIFTKDVGEDHKIIAISEVEAPRKLFSKL